MGSSTPSESSPTHHNDDHHHVVLFPFMSKGHTIPLLHLAHLLLSRRFAVTVFTTLSNQPFMISNFLSNTPTIKIITLPFPQTIHGIPPGIESTDKLPSISLVYTFAKATKLMQPHFEQALEEIHANLPISFIVSDGFLWWTLESATKFNIPRLSFYGMNTYSMALSGSVAKQLGLGPGPRDDDDHGDRLEDNEVITLRNFPWIRLRKDEYVIPDEHMDPDQYEFMINAVVATSNSYGLIVNSFVELEGVFVDFYNSELKPKAWCVGPLCLAEPPEESETNSEHFNKGGRREKWMEWLDQKLSEGRSVLYVAFGSQAEISPQQVKEIAIGLEESQVNFMWVLRKSDEDGFEERVKDRGIVVRKWVNQKEILMHESVQGFFSHCGWNSVMESICCGVPILAWPMMAEQPLNAKMVEEEIKIGMRVETSDGLVKGFVKWEGLVKMVRELMEGEKGKEARKKVKEVGEMAKKAMHEGGSSCQSLTLLLDEICMKKKVDNIN